MAEFNDVDDFLKHNARPQSGSRLKRISSWKKDGGRLRFWLHPQVLPFSVWSHQIPEVIKRQDRETRETKTNIWGRDHVCLETEAVLKKSRYRNKDGSREVPPVACPVCKLVEHVRGMITRGEVRDVDTIFAFRGSDAPKEDRTITAGGFVGIWKWEETAETKARCKAAGVMLSEAFKEKGVSQQAYVFAIVNNDDPEAGVVVLRENTNVGEKVRDLIADEIDSKDDAGNPFLNPYCIELIYSADAEPAKKYRARRIDKIQLTDDIKELLEGDKPDLSAYTSGMNPTKVIAALEEACVVKGIPWESFLDGADRSDEDDDDPAKSEPAPSPKPAKSEPAKTVPQTSTGRKKVEAAPKHKPEDYGDPCDDCGAPMLKDATECLKCGAKYATDDGPPSGDEIPF